MSKPKQQNAEGLQVIGVGLPRTGTWSLYHAFEILNLHPCHHFKPSIIDEFFPYSHARRWLKVFSMKNDKAGRQALIRQQYAELRCKSALDYPTAGLAEDLVEIYPQAKFILGVRSDAAAWRKSFDSTVGRFKTSEMYYATLLVPAQRVMQPLLAKFDYWDRDRLGASMYYPPGNLEVYDRFNDNVRKVVPKDRLLEFDPKMGWEPLCKFLNVPIPTDKDGKQIPYPHVNDTSDFQMGLRIAFTVGMVSWAIFFGVVGVTMKYFVLPAW